MAASVFIKKLLYGNGDTVSFLYDEEGNLAYRKEEVTGYCSHSSLTLAVKLRKKVTQEIISASRSEFVYRKYMLLRLNTRSKEKIDVKKIEIC